MLPATQIQHINTYIIILSLCLQSCATPKIIDFTVTDTSGSAIQGANINVISGYESLNLDVSGKSGPGKFNKVTDHTGKTDQFGNYTFFGLISFPPYVTAIKDGYYQTAVYPYDNKQITIPLRKKINPVVMLTKTIFQNLPSSDGIYGFDVIEGDLVQPHGYGTHSDFELQINTYINTVNGKQYKIQNGTIVTPDKNDGFIAHYTYTVNSPTSIFNGVYVAPDNVYAQSIKEAREVS